jgi:hypothetical protein
LHVINTGGVFATAEMQSVYTAVSGAAFKESSAVVNSEALAQWFE